jgi:hypothetical protein
MTDSKNLWDAVVACVAGYPQVVEASSQFAERPALWVDGRELAYLDGPVLGLRLPRSAEREAVGPAVRARLVRRPGSDWVHVPIDALEELGLGQLMAAAVAANRRPGWSGPPAPEPERIARRRRWHQPNS